MLVSDAAQVAKQFDVFVEDSYEVVRDWWVVAGAQAVSAHRFQDDRVLTNGDQSGNTVWRTANPKIGVLHDLTATAQAYANLSRSFEPPTFAEYVATDTSGTTRPQTDMEAQSAWTAELGTRGAMEVMSWDVSLYYAWVRNELLSYQVAPGLNQTVNANRTRHAGVELGHSLELVENALASQDRIVLENTWTTGWFHFDDDVVYGNNQLPGLPAHAWRGEVRWERKGWYAGPVLEWQSAIPVDFANTTEAEPSFLVGARGGYRSPHGFSAFVEGKNLADRHYIATTTIANPSTAATNQALYYPGDGLTLVAGVEWTY
jgi:iron complex outermembrane receptor protein